MLIKEIHNILKPRSVGRDAKTDEVLRWRTRSQQLWRWTVYEAEQVKIEPVRLNEYRGEHQHAPRKGDRVLVDGKFGSILYVNYSEQEAMVRVFDNGLYEDNPYDLSVFETNQGKIPWRILG